MMIPGYSQAITAEAAINKKSIFTLVKRVTTQQTQQKIPPQNIGLNLQAAPVINVGKPYNISKSGVLNSRKEVALLLVNFPYSTATGSHTLKITLRININRKIQMPNASQI